MPAKYSHNRLENILQSNWMLEGIFLMFYVNYHTQTHGVELNYLSYGRIKSMYFAYIYSESSSNLCKIMFSDIKIQTDSTETRTNLKNRLRGF